MTMVSEVSEIPTQGDFALFFRQAVVKRMLDVTLAAILLGLLAPILLVVAIAVKCSSRGPVIFRQERVGRGGRPFRVCKFRTMRDDAEGLLAEDERLRSLYLANGFKLPAGLDTRVTKVGGFLRKSSIDEVPQLWNVLLGQMSLVGPRPVVPLELESLFGSSAHLYELARPGITGYWQVSGRSEIGPEERRDLECYYLENWSLVLDLVILAKTVPTVLSTRGAH